MRRLRSWEFESPSAHLFLFTTIGYQLKAEECGAKRRTLPLNFYAFSGKPNDRSCTDQRRALQFQALRNADFITWNFTTKTPKPRRNTFVFFVPLWFNPELSGLF
ncbi:MAG: hypothetical protein RLZZ435_3199, partial [Cyanobacteriota bacterium]